MASISSTICRSSASRAVSSFLGTAASTATRQRCNALPLRHSAVRTHAVVRNVQSSSKASVTLLHHHRENSRSMVTVTKTEAGSAPVPPPQVTVTQSSSNDTSTSADEDITITASCAQQIKRLAAKRPDGGDSLYLRLYVDAGGCSGFEYKFELETDEAGEEGSSAHNDDDEDEMTGIDPEDDIVFTKDGARVVIDKTSLDLLRGSTVDFVQEMIRSSFAVVNNPISESACGCGSSFAVKNFEANPALD